MSSHRDRGKGSEFEELQSKAYELVAKVVRAPTDNSYVFCAVRIAGPYWPSEAMQSDTEQGLIKALTEIITQDAYSHVSDVRLKGSLANGGE